PARRLELDREPVRALRLGAVAQARVRVAEVVGDGRVALVLLLRGLQRLDRLGRLALAQELQARLRRARGEESGADRDHACAPRRLRSRSPSWFMRRCTLRRVAPGPNSPTAMRS